MNSVCKEIRQDILHISRESGHGHIPSCFSVVDIIYAIYDTMKHDPSDPDWDGRDIFVLSKGHAALSHYCVLAKFGYFPMERVYTFGAYKSDFGCHSDRHKVAGVEVSTGSLGHGIGVAVGIALAQKLKSNGRQAYSVIGDGEANEGSVWEAIMVATNLKLSNLTVIYDNNMSHSRGLQIMEPGKRFEAFGCQVLEVDGHDVDALKMAFNEPHQGVKTIIAHTKKGFGCKTMVDNHYAWHRRSPTNEELGMLLEELDEAAV